MRLLKYHAQVVAEGVLPDVLDVKAVEGDAAVLRLVEAVDEVGDSGLSGTRSAHKGNLLAGVRGEGYVVKHLLFRYITKVHVLEGNLSLDVFQLLFSVIHFRLLVQQGVQAVRSRSGHHDGIDLVGDGRYGPGEVALQGEEGYQRTQGEGGAVQSPQEPGRHGAGKARQGRDAGRGRVPKGNHRAHQRQQHIGEVADVGVYRHDDIAYLVGVVHAGAQLLIQLLKFLHGHFLVAVYLHHLLAGNHLLNEAVHLAQILLPFHKVFLGKLAQAGGHPVHEPGHEDGNQRERKAKDQHAHKSGQDGDQRLEQVGNAASHNLPEGVHIVGIHGHDVSVGMAVKVPQRQLFHVGEEVFAEAQERALPHIDHNEALGISRNDTCQQHARQLEEGHRQGTVVRI